MKFEWIKFIKNPKNLFLIILAFLSIFVSLANVHFDKINAQKEDYNYLKAVYNEIDPPQDYAGPSEPYKLLHHLDDSRKNFLSKKDKEMYEILFQIIYLLEDENTAKEQKDEEARLSIQQERLKLQLEYIEMGGERWENEPNIKDKINYNEWLIKNHLTIVNLEHGQQGFYFIYYLLNHWMQFFLIGIIGLFFFDFLSTEYEKKTYRLLFTQPISKGKFFLRKYATALLIIFSLLFIFLLISFILASLIYEGTGSLNYPISVYSAQGVKLIPLSQLFIQSLTLQVLFISFLTGSLLFISQVLKKSLETLGLVFLVFFLPNIVFLFIRKSMPYLNCLPVFFMNSITRITEMMSYSNNTFSENLLWMLLWNSLLWFSMFMYVRRKKI